MKKWKVALCSVLLVALIGAGYHFSFPIYGDLSNLDAYLGKWINNGHAEDCQHYLDIHNVEQIGNRYYAVIEYEDQYVGYVLLSNSYTGRHSVERLSVKDTSDFCNGIVKIQGTNYLVFIGRNTTGAIKTATFAVDDMHTYQMEIPEQDVFMVYIEVDSGLSKGSVAAENITLHDAMGEDITAQFTLQAADIK